jgi:hypothetical protein
VDLEAKFVQERASQAATLVFMTSQAVVAIAKQARSALVSIRAIPGLTEGDDAETRRLITEADQLTASFRDQGKTPAAEKAWLTGLRLLVARGREIERKYTRGRSTLK